MLRTLLDLCAPQRAGFCIMACFKPLVKTRGRLNAKAQGNPRQVLNVLIGIITTMQGTHFIHQSLTIVQQLIRVWLNSAFSFERKAFSAAGVSRSHFEHNLTLSSFAYQVRIYKFAKMRKPISGCYPSPVLFPGVFWSLFFGIFVNNTSKSILQPIEKRFFTICNFHICLVILGASLRIGTKVTDIYRSFSVNYSRKICKLHSSIFLACIVTFSHINSFLKGWLTIQYQRLNVQPQRLTLVAPKGEVIVRAAWKHAEVRRNDLLAA